MRYLGDDSVDKPIRGRRIDKDRFCKKNKTGDGRFGPHVYNDGRCIYCNKIDPSRKHRSYNV